MKRAIVFAGGGTKGAYQAGVVKAIRELNISFDIVTGTSIGALNGCLLAQNDDEQLYHLWENLDLEDIMEDGMDLKFTFENMLQQSDLIKPFLKSYLTHKGANIAPLKEMINQLCDEKRLQESGIQFGLVTTEYPSLKGCELDYLKMEGKLKEYLLASASCFPAFPICKIDDHQYIDGGYFDNLPIDLAFQMGADEIIAVEITYDRFTHPHYENRPNITVIRPTNYNGQFLDFDANMLSQRQKLGYNDAMKKLGGYLGNTYTFYPYSNEELERKLYFKILNYEGNLNRSFVKRNSKIIQRTPLSSIVFDKFKDPSMKSYLLSAIEITAELWHMDPFEIYHLDELLEKLNTLFHQDLEAMRPILNDNFLNFDGNIKEQLSSLSKKDVVIYLYLQMAKDYQKFLENWIYPFFNREMLCAFLLSCL